MMRYIFPSILILLSIASFILFTSPTYKEIKTLKQEAAAYDAALTNALNLQKVRDTLSEKYRSLTPEQIDRLSKLLPDNVDNIRLIIDIQRIATNYGMLLTSVKFDTLAADPLPVSPDAVQGTPETILEEEKEYGSFNLEFNTAASYQTFLLFLADLEKSLRIIDISSINFTSDTEETGDTYKYGFKIKTYWLKN